MPFAWSIVQPESDLRAASLAEVLHRRSLGDVLPHQAVGILVRATLPGVVGRGKVEGGAGRPFDVPIAVEFGSVVDGDRLEHVAMGANQLNDAAVRGCDRARA